MPRHCPPNPAEFWRQLVELVRWGGTPEELSRELEPSAQVILNWVRQAERDSGRRGDGLPSRLPKEQQDMLAAAGVEATEWINRNVTEPGEATAYKKMVELGMQVAEPANIEDWSKPMQPMWAELTTKTPGSDRLLKLMSDVLS